MAFLSPSLARGIKAFLQIACAVALFLFAGDWNARAQTEISKEYQVKAVFLFNFAEFVDWPADAFTNTQEPLILGVLGDDPFGNYLDETVRGESANGHPLIVQRFRRVEDVKVCHLLFISRSEQKNLDSILAALKGREILTVSDIENFATDGGVIGFIKVQNRVHFAVNLQMAKTDKLSISSKVLRLADIVKK